MKDKGFSAMMVGYALNHGAGTYRLYNPKTKRIIMSRNVTWLDFKSKQLEEEFDLLEPGIRSLETGSEEKKTTTLQYRDMRANPGRKRHTPIFPLGRTQTQAT